MKTYLFDMFKIPKKPLPGSSKKAIEKKRLQEIRDKAVADLERKRLYATLRFSNAATIRDFALMLVPDRGARMAVLLDVLQEINLENLGENDE